ncbi:hypothetical protein B0H19DRAFT_1193012 [Mycena capillaripes]|nr:hypothetical protein B0H19DRAFT_1193012 [Mycena capillaripes]
MLHKFFSAAILAFFVLGQVAASGATPEARQIGASCSVTVPCISGHCCLARKRGVILNRGTCLPEACPG